MKKIFLLLLLAFGGSGLNAQNMGKVGNGLGKSSKPIIPKHLKKGNPTIFRWEMMYGYILNDSILIPFEYEQLDEKFSDFMLAKRNGYWGAINKKGEVVLPFDYKILRQHKNGPLLAKKGTDTGLINRSNKALISLEYNTITEINDSILVFNRQYKQLIVNVLNQDEVRIISSLDYDWFERLGNNTFPAFSARPNGGKTGIVDLENRVLLPFEYWKITRFSGNLIWVGNEKEFYGLVNFQNQARVPMIYRSIEPTENPNAFLVNDEKWKKGLVDSMGKVLIPTQFNYCWVLNNPDLVKCKMINRLYALWSTNGNQLSKDIYEDISASKALPEIVFALVPESKKYQILNAQGKIIYPNLVDGFTPFQSGFSCSMANKSAIFDRNGKQLTDFVYTIVTRVDSSKDAEKKALSVDLLEGTLLICTATNAVGARVYVDNMGKEILVKND